MKALRILGCLYLFIICFMAAGRTGVQAEMLSYDANGNFLGIYAGSSNNNIIQIYVPSIERTVDINMSTGDLIGRDIYFVSGDCFVSGDPYVVAEGSYTVIQNGSEYYTGSKAVPEQLQINSVFRSYNSQCEGFSGAKIVVPAQEIVLPFSMPTALPLTIEVPRKYSK